MQNCKIFGILGFSNRIKNFTKTFQQKNILRISNKKQNLEKFQKMILKILHLKKSGRISKFPEAKKSNKSKFSGSELFEFLKILYFFSNIYFFRFRIGFRFFTWRDGIGMIREVNFGLFSKAP